MRLAGAAKVVRAGLAETLAYTRFPPRRWRRIRTDSAVERLSREIGRRTRVVGAFPDGGSALMLVTARLRYVADSEWGLEALSGRDAAGRGAVPEGGRLGLSKTAQDT